MTSCRYIVGDVFDALATLPDASIDLVLTSPPFIALRSYLPDDHPDKAKEIGQEATPAEFIDTMLRLSAEWERVLAAHGSIAVELGDTYSGSGGAGGDYSHDGLRAGQNEFTGSARKKAKNRNSASAHLTAGGPVPGGHMLGGQGWPLAKSACQIPELFRVALTYGLNPLTGEPSPSGRWRVRNTVRWVRPNPPVGALGDKFRPATSDMVIACKATDRWFDLDAVRKPYSETSHARVAAAVGRRPNTLKTAPDGNRDTLDIANNDGSGAPPLDWWKISPAGFAGSHYATWPPELLTIPIEAMCPREVCTVCGQPRRRITETLPGEGGVHPGNNGGTKTGYGKGHRSVRTVVSSEWSDCGHDSFRPGVVLDPFGGSGTTGMVATGHGRDAILVDIDERNADLAWERVGMFITVETLAEAAA